MSVAMRALCLCLMCLETFTHDSYSAFAKVWSLAGIPHMMVPCQASLEPNWNFQPSLHAQQLKVDPNIKVLDVTYPTYMPALNRAGWYKHLFLEVLQAGKMESMLQAFCADTYKPGVLHPDMNKRDTYDSPLLRGQTTVFRAEAMGRARGEVFEQMRTVSQVAAPSQGALQPGAPQGNASQQSAAQQGASTQDASQGSSTQDPAAQGSSGGSGGTMTDEEMVVQLHSLKMQNQFSNMMAYHMFGGGFGGGPNYGSMV